MPETKTREICFPTVTSMDGADFAFMDNETDRKAHALVVNAKAALQHYAGNEDADAIACLKHNVMQRFDELGVSPNVLTAAISWGWALAEASAGRQIRRA